jgi:predicted PurR-regulated permease PerM
MIPPSHGQSRVIWLAATGLALAVLIALAVGFVWGLGRVLDMLSPVLWPLAVAGVLAYLLDPVVNWFEAKRMQRRWAIVTVFGIGLVIVASMFGSIVPQLVTETRQLVSRIPDYADKLRVEIEEVVQHPPGWLQRFLRRDFRPPAPAPSSADTNELSVITNAATTTQPGTNSPPLFTNLLDKETLQSAAGGLAGALHKTGAWLFGRVATWFGILTGLALIPVYAFYLLLEKERISSRWADYLPVKDSSFKRELVFLLKSTNDYMIAFFRGQVLVGICDGLMYMLGFLIIRLDYALLLGAAAMVLTIIPFLGAIIICVASLVIALVQFGDWFHPLLVLVVFSVAQSIEALVISPKIMGGRVGLHPLTIIIAVMAGTTLLGGLLGGILAIPLTAVLRVVMFRYVWKQRTDASGASS